MIQIRRFQKCEPPQGGFFIREKVSSTLKGVGVQRHIFKVEQAVLDSLQGNGGSMHLSALARDPEVSSHRGAGVEMIDVILAMMIRGFVGFDCETRIVTG